jgi:ADP-heptose:LPS heptosyltransferase
MYKERQFSLVELGAILSQKIMPNISEIRLYGGPNDIADSKNYCVYLSKLLNINVKNCSGIFNLSQMVTEINSIGTLITIDSGINHIARLTNVRVISNWGPSDPNLRLRHILPNESIIYHKLPCSPCVHLMDQTPCNGNNICLSQYLGNSTANILWLLK